MYSYLQAVPNDDVSCVFLIIFVRVFVVVLIRVLFLLFLIACNIFVENKFLGLLALDEIKC